MDKSKQYSLLKYGLSVVETAYLLGVLVAFLASGLSRECAAFVSRVFTSRYVIIPAYLFIVSAGYALVNLPLAFYRTYTVEHRFGFSTQTPWSWFVEQLKGFAVTLCIGTVCLEVFYYIIKHNPSDWWLLFSLFWVFFSVVMAHLAPVVIIPLFFKYTKVSDPALKERVMALAARMKVAIRDVYEIDLSRKTLKANAAFVGWGRTKRVLLSDTLNRNYSADQVEVIMAHEFAHYKLKHIGKLVCINCALTMLSFFVLYFVYVPFFGWFGLHSILDIAALPAIAVYFLAVGIVVGPLENFISRRFERHADLCAVQATGLSEAFVATMEKLAAQNLADRRPPALIKFFFFDHPPIDERIAMVRGIQAAQRNQS